MPDLTREQIEELVERLSDRMKLKYSADCKCGNCQLISMSDLALAPFALRQLLTATEWKPIETARKDGTEILLTGTMNVDGEDYPEHIAAEISASRPVVIGRWTSSSGCTIWQDEETSELRRVQVRERWHHAGWDVESNGLEPTHWMPLPKEPSDA
jgi:hypothetical protein